MEFISVERSYLERCDVATLEELENYQHEQAVLIASLSGKLLEVAKMSATNTKAIKDLASATLHVNGKLGLAVEALREHSEALSQLVSDQEAKIRVLESRLLTLESERNRPAQIA